MVITFREDELERIITAKDIEIVNLKEEVYDLQKRLYNNTADWSRAKTRYINMVFDLFKKKVRLNDGQKERVIRNRT